MIASYHLVSHRLPKQRPQSHRRPRPVYHMLPGSFPNGFRGALLSKQLNACAISSKSALRNPSLKVTGACACWNRAISWTFMEISAIRSRHLAFAIGRQDDRGGIASASRDHRLGARQFGAHARQVGLRHAPQVQSFLTQGRQRAVPRGVLPHGFRAHSLRKLRCIQNIVGVNVAPIRANRCAARRAHRSRSARRPRRTARPAARRPPAVARRASIRRSDPMRSRITRSPRKFDGE